MKEPSQLLRASIIDILEDDLMRLKENYNSRDIAGFVRVEGGTIREIFTNPIPYDDPKKMINFLPISDDRKTVLLDIYSRLTPGLILVVLDTDSDDIDNRVCDWFIV